MSDRADASRKRVWPVFIAPGLVLIGALAWTAFWFFAASEVGVKADAWRAQEAKSGRIYDCANRSVGGFPFRFEIRCDTPSVALVAQAAGQSATAPSVTGKLGSILVVAQVYDPKRVIAEFTGPATITETATQSAFNATWSSGLASVYGLPEVPQRAAVVFDRPAIERASGATRVPVARADHVELHLRTAPAAASEPPAIDAVLQISNGNIQEVHPLLAAAFNADIRARLTGLRDLTPKPWPQRFRELQAAGGQVEITQSRVEQGEVLSVAAGTLSLSPSGNLNGELQMTVAGLERIIPALGIDKMLEKGIPQSTLDRVAPGVRSQDITNLMGALDRAVPGLGKIVQQNANVGVAAGINALGKEAVLEGRKARSFPLRFAEGAVFFGPLRVAQLPPLF